MRRVNWFCSAVVLAGLVLIGVGAYTTWEGPKLMGATVIGFALGVWLTFNAALRAVDLALGKLETELSLGKSHAVWLAPDEMQGLHEVVEYVPEQGISDAGSGVAEPDRA